MANTFQQAHAREIGLLLSLVLATPLFALGGEQVGVVQSSGTVYVDHAAVSAGTQIKSGDHLQTASASAAVALPMGSTVLLEPRSAVTMSRLPDGVHISLERGNVTFSASASEGVHVLADGVMVSPKSTDAGLAEFALNGDGSLRIAVRSGSLLVANLRADPVTVRAGQFINVSPRVAQNDRAGTAAGGKLSTAQKARSFQIGSLSHNASVALIAIIAGGIATGIALAVR
jgi:ferric-dicitrate binding protein FerR (iron transport regulator)